MTLFRAIRFRHPIATSTCDITFTSFQNAVNQGLNPPRHLPATICDPLHFSSSHFFNNQSSPTCYILAYSLEWRHPSLIQTSKQEIIKITTQTELDGYQGISAASSAECFFKRFRNVMLQNAMFQNSLLTYQNLWCNFVAFFSQLHSTVLLPIRWIPAPHRRFLPWNPMNIDKDISDTIHVHQGNC